MRTGTSLPCLNRNSCRNISDASQFLIACFPPYSDAHWTWVADCFASQFLCLFHFEHRLCHRFFEASVVVLLLICLGLRTLSISIAMSLRLDFNCQCEPDRTSASKRASLPCLCLEPSPSSWPLVHIYSSSQDNHRISTWTQPPSP